MDAGFAINVGLPATLVIIMLGLGLSLRVENFLQVIAKPWPLIVGLCCQLLLLPAVCFAILSVSDLPVSIAVGMMLLAASPGGTTAALYTHLARGDVALSLTFAAATSVLALLSLPLIANLSLAHFVGEERAVGLQITQVLQIFAIALVPAIIGAMIRSRRPALAQRLDGPVKLLASLFLILVIVFALVSHWGLLLQWGPAIGATVLIFNVLSLVLGYAVPKLIGIARPQAIALAFSISIHNAALVITVALSEFMLNEPEMAIPSGLYGVLAYLTSAAFVWLLNRRPVPVSN